MIQHYLMETDDDGIGWSVVGISNDEQSISEWRNKYGQSYAIPCDDWNINDT